MSTQVYTLSMITNPLTAALVKSGTQPIDLAKQLRISRQMISRMELGCPLNLNGPIVRWIHSVLRDDFPDGLAPQDIQVWYHRFKSEKRLFNLQNFLLRLPEFPADSNAFRRSIELEYPSGSISQINRTLLNRVPRQRVVSLQEAFNHPPKLSPLSPVARPRSPRTVKEAFVNWRNKYWSTSYAFAKDMCVNPVSVDRYESGQVNDMPADIRLFINWLREALMMIHGENFDQR